MQSRTFTWHLRTDWWRAQLVHFSKMRTKENNPTLETHQDEGKCSFNWRTMLEENQLNIYQLEIIRGWKQKLASDSRRNAAEHGWGRAFYIQEVSEVSIIALSLFPKMSLRAQQWAPLAAMLESLVEVLGGLLLSGSFLFVFSSAPKLWQRCKSTHIYVFQ